MEAYSYSEHPIEKSIYLSKEGEQIPPPFPHGNHSKHSKHLHLQEMAASKAKPITISQVNTSSRASSAWDFLSCCREVTTVQFEEYEDCGICNRRVFKESASTQPAAEEAPYTSAYRMLSRQRQPVQVFYDRVKSHELCGQRWRRD